MEIMVVAISTHVVAHTATKPTVMCEANLAIQIDRRRFCLGVRGFINISELNLPCKWCTNYDENYYLIRKIFGGVLLYQQRLWLGLSHWLDEYHHALNRFGVMYHPLVGGSPYNMQKPISMNVASDQCDFVENGFSLISFTDKFNADR